MREDTPPLHVTVEGLEVVDVRERERYEGRLTDGAAASDRASDPAVTVYARDGALIALQHTEVPPALEGQGIARRLVQAVLDDVRARGLTVIPNCPYVRSFLRKHPAYRDLVHPRYAASLDRV